MKRNNRSFDEILKSADLSERIMFFLQKNIKPILIAVGLLVAGIFTFIINDACAKRTTRSAQRDFSNILTDEDRANFIKKYKRNKLSGVVMLSIGDGYFAAEQYADAATAYDKAARILEPTVFALRARTNQAIAAYKSGQLKIAEDILNSIYGNKKCDKVFRSNACYTLAEILKDSGNQEKLKILVTRAEKMDLTEGFFQAIKELTTKN